MIIFNMAQKGNQKKASFHWALELLTSAPFKSVVLLRVQGGGSFCYCPGGHCLNPKP